MIYLDNAATSFPKPESVISEMQNCMKSYSGNPGRSGHSLSFAAAAKVFECREAASEFFGCSGPENIIFTLNATHAINMLIKGILRRGDHVLISDLEHNSVYRPIFRLASEGHITYSVFPSMALDNRRTPGLICSYINKLIQPNTKLLICTHASNICSATLPLREIGQLCRRRGMFFAVDAAQSAGHMDINMEKLCIDALCVPGHKGLLGPMGSGMLLLKGDVLLDTLMEGGSGVNSLEGFMPDFSPERYETGTLAVPAIAGLCEGIKTVQREGVLSIRARIETLNRYLTEMLSTVSGVTLYASQHCGAVLLFNIKDIPAETAGRELDKRGVCVRSGFHCSPIAHATLQTPENGAVRASIGFFNTKNDIESLWKEVRQLAK